MLQVGKGLSKDEKAQKLALQHWLEAVSLSEVLNFNLSNIQIAAFGYMSIVCIQMTAKSNACLIMSIG